MRSGTGSSVRGNPPPPPAPNAGAEQPAPPQHPPGVPGASGTQQAATGPVSGITQQSDDQERKDDERL